jgi:hypothetical protein
VQYDQWPAFAVDLVVHPEAVDLGVVALGSVHPFPFLLAAGAMEPSLVTVTMSFTPPCSVRLFPIA